MKIMNTLTLRYLKANKKRSLLTLLCIMVSVIMMSCVGIAFSSGKDYYKNYLEQTEGDYHYDIYGVNDNVINIIKNDPDIDEYYMSSMLNYDYDDFSISVLAGDSVYFQKLGIQDYILEGRLPDDSHEIILSQSFLEENHINKKIGDNIQFNDEKTYEIVGIMSFYQIKNHFKDTCQGITYVDMNESPTVYIRDKNVSTHIFEHTEQLKDKLKEKGYAIGIEYHTGYLAIQDIFEKNSSSSFLDIYKMIGILMLVIVITSIMIIYQAFHLSTTDRIQYLGMLSSVGATPKQKKRSVYFEGLILSIIAIPLGIMISYIGLTITFQFVNEIDIIKQTGIIIYPQISIVYLMIVMILSFITVMIALYIPARKISKISVMDALRKSDEIKVKKSKLKVNILMRKYGSISGQMALKNYKRQGKRSKVIVLSLVISMCLFITVFSFSQMFVGKIKEESHLRNYDVIAYASLNDIQDLNKTLKTKGVDDYYIVAYNYVSVDMNTDYLQYENPDSNIGLYALDDLHFRQLCQDNDIQPSDNQALIYDRSITIVTDDAQEIKYDKPYLKMDKDFIKKIEYEIYDGNNNTYKSLELFDSIELIHTKDKYYLTNQHTISVIVSLDYIQRNQIENGGIDYYIQTDQHSEICETLESMGINTLDVTANTQMTIQITQIAQFFVYGFVTIIVLLTLLNILNMMSASIEKRKKEFAMMMSVGISQKDMSKILFYESFVYGMKVLIYSIPLCLGIEYVLYSVSELSNEFHPSWLAYMISFIVICIVMMLTFHLGFRHFRKQNIIETLKDDI